MARGYNVRNGGVPTISLGLFNVNSLNIAPYTVVATAAGTLLNQGDIDKFELFTVAQTSAATDLVLLPVVAPIGTKVHFVATSVARIKAGANGSGLTINGAADTLSVPLVVGGLAEFTKISATNWMCQQFSAAGAVTAPTPS